MELCQSSAPAPQVTAKTVEKKPLRTTQIVADAFVFWLGNPLSLRIVIDRCFSFALPRPPGYASGKLSSG